MNSVQLIGRLTRDPETMYASGTQMAVCTFTIAVDAPRKKDGTKTTDYPRVKTFGRQAETCETYLKKGRMVGISGRLSTGSYQNKKGDTVYTADVLADRVDFIDWGDEAKEKAEPEKKEPAPEPIQQSFEAIDDDVPF